MTAAGIISREEKGVFVLYRANREGPFFEKLHSILVAGRKSGTPFVQSILKKFEVKDEYEKRNIVFWYDRDRTADAEGLESIKSALAEKGIKTTFY